jgi:hypothetical protein
MSDASYGDGVYLTTIPTTDVIRWLLYNYRGSGKRTQLCILWDHLLCWRHLPLFFSCIFTLAVPKTHPSEFVIDKKRCCSSGMIRSLLRLYSYDWIISYLSSFPHQKNFNTPVLIILTALCTCTLHLLYALAALITRCFNRTKNTSVHSHDRLSLPRLFIRRSLYLGHALRCTHCAFLHSVALVALPASLAVHFTR